MVTERSLSSWLTDPRRETLRSAAKAFLCFAVMSIAIIATVELALHTNHTLTSMPLFNSSYEPDVPNTNATIIKLDIARMSLWDKVQDTVTKTHSAAIDQSNSTKQPQGSKKKRCQSKSNETECHSGRIVMVHQVWPAYIIVVGTSILLYAAWLIYYFFVRRVKQRRLHEMLHETPAPETATGVNNNIPVWRHSRMARSQRMANLELRAARYNDTVEENPPDLRAAPWRQHERFRELKLVFRRDFLQQLLQFFKQDVHFKLSDLDEGGWTRIYHMEFYDHLFEVSKEYHDSMPPHRRWTTLQHNNAIAWQALPQYDNLHHSKSDFEKVDVLQNESHYQGMMQPFQLQY